ncbi:HNH endonuclease signature motif containing protein [Agromyces lapidis]|uniref:DUF222 domain-containing protein n=1 Tax=Agromyces lapidis TaxID=279574 RepID=A0ABV5SQM5_9MICO|nr:HNH endonuclease signature motif containing protein [Agromyces lapidis]
MPDDTAAALIGLGAACIGLDATWRGALLGGSVDPGADVRMMSDAGLVRVTESLGDLVRHVQALQARAAAELAARSRSGAHDDVARKHGFASAERLIASAIGGRYHDAAKLVAVGEATAPRSSFGGESLPPRHPHLAAALESGILCVDAAETIRRFLDQVAPRAERSKLVDAERLLVERAPSVGVDGLIRLVKHLQAHLDPDGVKPREDELRAARGLRIWEDRTGMIQLQGAFDPANGAPVKLAIETLVGSELHRARDAKRGFGQATTGPGSADTAIGEVRSIAQMNADALSDIARLSLGAADAPAPLRQASVIARVDAAALACSVGSATIDGIDQPVSIQTVRELAMSAGISPLYLGAGCEKTEFGRSRRLFSSAQKAVLLERDGGCAWPGCNRPPSHTQAHHIRWWNRHGGDTDVDNGIMLCAHHHHRLHDDGWVIRVKAGSPGSSRRCTSTRHNAPDRATGADTRPPSLLHRPPTRPEPPPPIVLPGAASTDVGGACDTR